MTAKSIVTTVVGSYPQPHWLIDRDRLKERLPPRVRAKELWRVAPDLLVEAQNDATIVAIRDMERAGIDIVSDGEIRRESYSNHFANALEGFDFDNPGEMIERTGKRNQAPRVAGPIHRTRPVQVADAEFLRRNTDREIRMTVPGPFTMTQQCQNDYYPDEGSLALAFADAVGEEIRDLFAAGVDVVQVDEPYLQARPEAAREYAVEAINKALGYATGRIALHCCFGYAHFNSEKKNAATGYPFLAELNELEVDQIVIEAAQPRLDIATLAELRHDVALGVVDLADPAVESPETVAERLRDALRHFSPERLSAAPDCGMKYLPREVAFGKLSALVGGAQIVREELG
jgi:5-methyltetrahydropteroyltriglutamate--homocysteine methyltransferase